ncbi:MULTISPECIES: ACP S-malonyltransferase [Kordiimonas]|jgi:[acyl-carrier-protein] S-malonyltransferase|uniref:Malonyl CoA-acyl carrier protein transacylase n=1 Tax=Kordiimonas lacus TaxID=637679 RepID=A0A1G6WW62_9PROT|nr:MULTISPECIES: ACP S-malonyltransferase [Kordiimonas]SDD70132.1 [acyl-carrier-protein] S-malonyltransferase [Kordiimonas lacus]
MTRALVFPGQGSQYVGMGKSLAEAFEPARLVFEEVNDALSQDLSKIMWEGPEDDLRLTENTQPALMAHSLAVIRILENGGLKVGELASHVAGHSLGEYSALASAGAFSVADAARLLKLRGQAMQRAVPVGEGAMAAILGLSLEDVNAVVEEAAKGQVVVAANDNADGQVVVSGDKAAVERAIEIAKAKGAKRGLLLPVSAPFHCPLMKPAALEMKDALADVTIERPVVPVIANVLAAPVSEPEGIRNLLVEQVTGAVRWRESVASMGSLGITDMVEVGAGKVLAGLARRIDRDLNTMNIQDPADIEAFTASL